MVNESDFSKLTRVLSTQGNAEKGSVSRAFGFYWTRKNVDLIARIIAEYTEQNQVVLDPFLGSGTSAIGTALAGKSNLFVGIELNEMPIQNLLLSLGVGSAELITLLPEARSVLELLRANYLFRIDDKEFILDKIIHDSTSDTMFPVIFAGRVGKDRVSYQKGTSEFEILLKDYELRLTKIARHVDQPLETNSRIAIKPGMKVSGVFGPLGYASLLRLRERGATNQAIKLIIGASLHLCRLTDAKSQSQFPFWFPKTQIHEKSVYEITLKKLAELEQVLREPLLQGTTQVLGRFQEWNPSTNESMILVNGDAASEIPKYLTPESVDLVITDPPYFDQVAYSEYLKLWEFFTGFKANLDLEVVESSRQDSGKTRSAFLSDLGNVFEQVRMAMKPGARALVYFKDSKPRNLHDFIATLERAGLSFVSQVHQTKPTFTYKQNTSKENTVGGDSIMVFVATERNKFGQAEVQLTKEEVIALDALFVEKLSQYIDLNGPVSLTEALDNYLIRELYPTGYLGAISSGQHFYKLAEQNFNYDIHSRKWSLKNE